MNLCTICQRVCEDRKWEDEGLGYSWASKDPVVVLYRDRQNGENRIMHDSWEIFLLSLSQDCPICWSMWRIIRSSPLAHAREEIRDEFQTKVSEAIYSLERSCYTVQLVIVEKDDRLHYATFDMWKTTKQCFLERCNTIQKLHTPETVAQHANRWVVDCLQTHGACHQRNIPSTTGPTRLLDIGGSRSEQWAIVKTDGDTKKYSKYIALSHRWAETTPKLMHKGGYRSQITYHDRELPQHFQDIISICRALDIHYLWIDSLCIFQDSDEDFRQEAGIMADIYENAFLTISICWDYSSTTLFQETRPQTIPLPPPADYLASRDKGHMEASTLPISHTFVEYRDSFSTDVANSLINQRGWVVQERFLSPRIIYLGNEQIYWECDVHIASEIVPHDLEDKCRRTFNVLDSTTAIGHLSWPSIMQAYSKCSLTRQEDRLIALSGLARSLSKRSGHTYFSGIWIEYWIHDLLWFPNTMILMTVDGTTQMTAPADNLGAPSWLWLGFPNHILPSSISREPEFTCSNLCSFKLNNAFALAWLANWKLNQSGTIEDAFTTFEGASLEIVCFLISTSFNEKEMIEEISYLNCGAPLYWHKDVKRRGSYLSCLPLQFMNSPELEAERSPERDPLLLEFSQRYDPSLPCALVPLYAWTNNEDQAPDRFQEPALDGLVVQEMNNGRPRQYKRIGRFFQMGSLGHGVTSTVLNTVSKQQLGAYEPSETDGEQAFKAAFLQYATTQTSLPMFADSTDDAKLSWSQVPQIKDLSWTKIELV